MFERGTRINATWLSAVFNETGKTNKYKVNIIMNVHSA